MGCRWVGQRAGVELLDWFGHQLFDGHFQSDEHILDSKCQQNRGVYRTSILHPRLHRICVIHFSQPHNIHTRVSHHP